MRFLRTLWTKLKGYIPVRDDDNISLEDDLGRFITSSSHFSKQKKRVKYNALLPRENPKSNKFETSFLI